MAGLISARIDARKNISLGDLDAFMDYVVNQSNGELGAAGLVKIALSFRALDMIAGAVSRMPLHIWRGDEDVTKAELPRYWADLQYRLCESYLLFNAAYALKENNVYGANVKWRFLVTPAMTIKTDPVSGALTGFTYNNQPIDNYEKKLLWWWWPNILAEVGPGSGPTNAALSDAALIKYLTEFATAYFQRGGFPVTLLQLGGPITQTEQEKIESWWNSMIAGVKRAFRAVLITNKITTTQIGSNIKDTIAPDLYQQSAHNVAIAYGIPISMLMSDAANYATAQQDVVTFYENTAIPIAERMIEVWNERVFEPQGLTIMLAPEELEAMQAAELQKAQALSSLVGGPILTRAEARAMLGYEEEEEPTTPESDTVEDEQADEAIDIEGKRLADEREKMKSKARRCLKEGKPFKFQSDLIPLADIEAVKVCTTLEQIDAVKFGTVRDYTAQDIAALLERATAAALELTK
jgi:HK97 family phage portal protein